MSFGSETPNSKSSLTSARDDKALHLFDPNTGLYQPKRNNIVQFKSKQSQETDTQIQPETDKWPAYISLSFAIIASLTLWAGIGFALKAIF